MSKVGMETSVDSNGIVPYGRKAPSRPRLIAKNGDRKVISKDVHSASYFRDLFTTILDWKWRYVMLIFCITYIGSWIAFAGLWYIIFAARGENASKDCFTSIYNFSDMFLFSLETQMTIGYGGRSITGKCPETVVLLVVQATISCLISAIEGGIIFIKFARPRKRESTVVFSQSALVTIRDGKFCLCFRLADIRKRQLSECTIRVHLYRTYTTREGKRIEYLHEQLRVGFDFVNIRDDSDRLFLALPATVCHVIDRKSPFYTMSPEKLADSDWEVVVVFEGCIETTGCTLQARTSYVANEIVWGFDFKDMVSFEDWDSKNKLRCTMKRLDHIERCPYVPRLTPKEYYIKSRDVEDAFKEQNELWESENFLLPEVSSGEEE